MTARAGIRPVVAVLAALLALAFPAAARAADVTVTTTADHNDKVCDAADCTLREAVELGTNTITLPKGTYRLTLGELLLVGDHIIGAGARASIIDGNGATRPIRAGDASSSIEKVTVTGGNGTSGVANGQGGGVYVQSGATLRVTASTISGNAATGPAAAGGGVFVAGTLLMETSEVSGNDVSGARSGSGGGIQSAGAAAIVNSTISGNTVAGAGTASQGGGVVSTGVLGLNGVTIANNTAATTGGLIESFVAGATVPSRQIFNTIVGGNSGAQCAGNGLDTDTTHNNLASDSTCALADATDIVADPRLGPLANNGGPTNTHALLAVGPASPAINRGAGCGTTDQRGAARPQPTGGVCDIGAFEYRSPTFTVVTTVVNDDGGPLTAAQVNVHVRLGGTDIKGSPAPGVATGRTYTLVAGNAYAVEADPVPGYTLSYSASCAPALNEGEARTCTVTANDKTVSRALPPPQRGKNVNALPSQGTVKIKLPGADKFVVLDEGEQIPLGTIVDVTKGRVTIVALPGDDATAVFYGGILKLGQTKGAKPITVLTLVEKLSCKGSAKKATTAKKKKRKRRLWGDGKGKFRTKGSFSSATVRGTKWLVQDTCTSTLTRVKRGKVAVRDFVKRKTVYVKAGHKYVARRRR